MSVVVVVFFLLLVVVVVFLLLPPMSSMLARSRRKTPPPSVWGTKSLAQNTRPATDDDLPPGWIRVKSKSSKSGAVYYAHPATKRTQAEHPDPNHPANGRFDPQLSGASVALEADEEKKDQRRATEEAREAEAAAREEGVRQARVAKRALEQAVVAEAPKSGDGHGSEDEGDAISAEEVRKWNETEEVREREEAEARRAEAEAERLRREEEERERREEEKRMEAERKKSEKEERERRRAAREMEDKENAYEAALAASKRKRDREEAERRKKEEDELKAKEDSRWKAREDLVLAQPASPPSSPPQSFVDDMPLQMKAAPKAEKPVLVKPQRIPEPSDPVACACLDVFKAGSRIGRHVLSGAKQSWTLGRAQEQVTILLGHESISRKHAEVSRQGMFTFLVDLGSAHGTVLNDQKIQKHCQERLCSGDNVRFGGSARIYVYREPSTVVQFDVTGTLQRSKSAGLTEVKAPPMDSPRQAAVAKKPTPAQTAVATPAKPAAPAKPAVAGAPPREPIPVAEKEAPKEAGFDGSEEKAKKAKAAASSSSRSRSGSRDTKRRAREKKRKRSSSSSRSARRKKKRARSPSSSSKS